MKAFRTTALALAVAMLATGCGIQATPGVQARLAGQTATAGQSLVAAYKAIAGHDDRAMAERLRLIAALGASGTEEAAQLLLSEYNRLGTLPAPVAERLDAPMLDAIASLAASQPTEMRAQKRFNVWKELDKLLGRKKRKRRSSGGGGTPPAPPAEEPML